MLCMQHTRIVPKPQPPRCLPRPSAGKGGGVRGLQGLHGRSFLRQHVGASHGSRPGVRLDGTGGRSRSEGVQPGAHGAAQRTTRVQVCSAPAIDSFVRSLPAVCVLRIIERKQTCFLVLARVFSGKIAVGRVFRNRSCFTFVLRRCR